MPRLAVQAEPVPIEHTVGRIAVLLNLEHHIARFDRVEPPAGDGNITVWMGRNPMQKVQNCTGCEGRFEITSADPVLQTDVNTGSFFCGDEIPELGLCLGENISCPWPPRMNLEREDVGGIEDLYQNRKPRVGEREAPRPERKRTGTDDLER